jgi:hypothetical protein
LINWITNLFKRKSIKIANKPYIEKFVIIEMTGEYKDLLMDNYGEEFDSLKEAESYAAKKNKQIGKFKYYVGRQQKYNRH